MKYMPDDSWGNFYDKTGQYVSRSDQFSVQISTTKELVKKSIHFVEAIQEIINKVEDGTYSGEIIKDPSGGVLSNYLTFS